MVVGAVVEEEGFSSILTEEITLFGLGECKLLIRRFWEENAVLERKEEDRVFISSAGTIAFAWAIRGQL